MNYLMLADRFHPVSPELEASLRLEDACGVLLEAQAAGELRRLLSAAAEDGVPIKPISGYRSTDYQAELFRRETAEALSKGCTEEEAERQVLRYLARPGESEHNCGLAADLAAPGFEETDPAFGLTGQGKWLRKNAHRFGFILRYPPMKEHLTGIMYEPWHYRYVGIEAADLIFSSGLCLEEFLHFYSDEFYPTAQGGEDTGH